MGIMEAKGNTGITLRAKSPFTENAFKVRINIGQVYQTWFTLKNFKA